MAGRPAQCRPSPPTRPPRVPSARAPGTPRRAARRRAGRGPGRRDRLSPPLATRGHALRYRPRARTSEPIQPLPNRPACLDCGTVEKSRRARGRHERTPIAATRLTGLENHSRSSLPARVVDVAVSQSHRFGSSASADGYARRSSKASAAAVQRARWLMNAGVVLAPTEASLHSLTVCDRRQRWHACPAAPGVVLPYGAEHVPRIRRGERRGP
jgi:hypothetical protein